MVVIMLTDSPPSCSRRTPAPERDHHRDVGQAFDECAAEGAGRAGPAAAPQVLARRGASQM